MTRLSELPLELLSAILWELRALELTRMRQVSKGWEALAEDANAWTNELREFDPLHIIGRPGFDQLRTQLGSWGSVARALTSRPQSLLCNYCEQCNQFCCTTCEEFVDGFEPNEETTSFEFALINRWSFQKMPDRLVHLVGVETLSAEKTLHELVEKAKPFDTLVIQGSFVLDEPLFIRTPCMRVPS
jgi:hypothetical protein